MAIDYRTLFASNYFTRAQVDLLVALSEAIIAESGGGGGVADNTKADKVTTLIAGTGLTGGGDLSTNRTFSLDLTFLDARYPLITDGKISPSVLPPISSDADTFVVASQAAMLAAAAVKGDFAVRTDVSKTFILSANPASTLGNWVEMLNPPAGVNSFNGRNGSVSPASGDYTFAQIASPPTTRAGYGITDAEGTITATTSADYYRGDKSFQPLNKAAVGLANVDNTADNAKPLGTAQLATLAASTGATLLGTVPPGTGATARTLQTELAERSISLKSFALANGSDDAARVVNWLTALKDNKRKGYIPAGTYTLTTDVAVTGDYFDIECHPEAKFVGTTGGANPMIQITSATGTASVPVGMVKWVGGQVDASARVVTTEGTGCGLRLVNFDQIEVRGAKFYGGADYSTTGDGGSGLRAFACSRGNINGNHFQGFTEEGLHVSGGTDTAAITDDGTGHVISGNHFVKCRIGVDVTRGSRSTMITDNDFDRCFEGACSLESDTAAKSGRVTVQGNRFLRCGKNAVHLRLQVGFLVCGNEIRDPFYELDAATPVTAATGKAVLLEGCKRGRVEGNIIHMDELATTSSTYGVACAPYTFNSITTQPEGIRVIGNSITGIEIGVSEAGAAGINNSYRDNDFISVTTLHDNIPASFLQYGTYTPTSTNITNIAANVPGLCMWRRTGPDITVNFYGTIDPTATGAAEIELELPVDPGYNFVNDYDLIGVAYSGTTGTGGHFVAKTGANRTARLLLDFETDVANHSWAGTFSYRCLPTVPGGPPPGGLVTLHTQDGTTPIHLEDGTTIIEV